MTATREARRRRRDRELAARAERGPVQTQREVNRAILSVMRLRELEAAYGRSGAALVFGALRVKP